MWDDLGRAVFAAASPPVTAAMLCLSLLLLGYRLGPIGPWTYLAAAGVLTGTLGGDWAWATGSAASLLVALAIRWWRSSKRRRAAALLGAKSRALRDTIVRRAREAFQPRPRLIPIPGGAQ